MLVLRQAGCVGKRSAAPAGARAKRGMLTRSLRLREAAAMIDREVYFEFTVIGRQVKVVAIDSATGLEVTVIGPSSAAQRDLQTLALRKLEKRLADLAVGRTGT